MDGGIVEDFLIRDALVTTKKAGKLDRLSLVCGIDEKVLKSYIADIDLMTMADQVVISSRFK